MSKKTITYVVLFAIIGIVLGYLIFGKIGGDYVSLKAIFSSSGGAVGSFARKAGGIAKIKQNILISGGVGVVLGFIISLIRKK